MLMEHETQALTLVNGVADLDVVVHRCSASDTWPTFAPDNLNPGVVSFG